MAGMSDRGRLKIRAAAEQEEARFHADLERLGIADGASIRVRSRHGELAGRARAAGIRPGNVQVFFPEGNVLVAADDGCEVSGMPAYTEVVEILPG